MDSGRFFFDAPHRGNMLILGNVDPIFRGPAGSLVSMELESSKRRPFLLSSPDDLIMEEEYFDEQLPEKKRRLTSEQVYLLEKSFESENKLEPERKTQLAKKLGLQPRQVAVWFQNRRARWKTKQLEKDYDLLKADYDSLVSNYDALLNHNNYLKSQVVFLTEKLQAKVNEEVVAAEMGPVAGNQAFDPELPGRAVDDPYVHVKVKGEDHLSSVGSAEVDEDSGPQIVDSGHSYFGGADDEYHGCMGQVAEEDHVDGRDEFSEVFAVGGEQPQLGLWGWS